MHKKLFIPGPVEVSPEVLKAMGEPIFPHYGPEWTRFYNETLTILRTVFNTSGSVFLMVGSLGRGSEPRRGRARAAARDAGARRLAAW